MSGTRKHVIVTGGAQGIGRIVTEELLNNNYYVSVFDIDNEAIEELRPLFHGKNCNFFITDVSNEISVNTSIKSAIMQSGSVYGLVNNAVYEVFKPMEDLTSDEWNKAISTNLSGTFYCSKHLAPSLRETKGSIVNMCSTRVLQSEANTESYSASKGGIFSLTHAMAISLAPHVRVNSISPGWIDVSAIKKKRIAKQIPLSQEDHLQHPAGRVGNAWDIARMVLFLLDEKNSFITGQNFTVDGGMTRKMIYV